MQVRLQVKISAVLVPAHIGRRVGFLEKQRRVVDQNVRADQVLHGIENFRVMHQLVSPVEQQVGLGFFGEVDQGTTGLLPGLELTAEFFDLMACQHIHREDKAVALVSFNLPGAQQQCHDAALAASIMAVSMSRRGCMGRG